MTPIRLDLPRDLPENERLSTWNADLRAGRIELDWSAVERASEVALRTLLAGVDEAADELGLGTVPSALVPLLGKIFSAPAPPPTGAASRPRRKKVKPAATAQVAAPPSRPAAWRPPAEAPAEATAPDAPSPAAPAQRPSPAAHLDAPPPWQLREQLVDMLGRDLVGPAVGEAEELTERSVRDRYILGALAPRGSEVAAEQQDELAVAGEDDEQGKAEPTARPSLLPSSLGLTFRVRSELAALHVEARWGRYERREATADLAGSKPTLVWKRIQFAADTTIELRPGALEPWSPDSARPAVTVEGIARRADDGWTVSLFLVNRQEAAKRRGDEAWLFQVALAVEGVGPSPESQPAFLRRTEDDARANDGGEDVVAMGYRDVVEFAVGHGVAVHATTANSDPSRATRLETVSMPRHEVGIVRAPAPAEVPELAGVELDAARLAELEGAVLASALRPLVTAYEAWIARQQASLNDPKRRLAGWGTTAELALERARRAATRVAQGIELLGTDPVAAQAFQFMNRAMAQQRVRSTYVEAVRRGAHVDLATLDVPKNRSWYPFQLALILLSLPGLTDLTHEDRAASADAVADLLWFPTGGGKTEAYLGLAAYTMAIRRLQGDVGGRSGAYGVAVLMRYTLRLLTLQQFQRAATLVCACESLRREDPATWGSEPFRIGLWVGYRVTPNTTAESHEAIMLARGTAWEEGGSGTPHQLQACPWCGHEIRRGQDLTVEEYPGVARTLVYCGDPLGTCAFSRRHAPGEGLPVVVVDEEIYRLLPAMLIATVDKFAQMPWRGEIAMLFGRIGGRCERHGFTSPEVEDAATHHRRGPLPPAVGRPHPQLRPPDLIIQDELHLISGPLGTLVGLYEAAVDRLATWQLDGRSVRPKVVASTATIRRAEVQTHALFTRRVEVFPPPGIDASDNFFAHTLRPSAATAGRLYLGICSPGRRLKAVLIRVYTALLAAGQLLRNQYGAEAVDPWLTLVGYFNSIRELAGMRRLVEDDVRTRLWDQAERGLAQRRISIESGIQELTSRRSSTEIPKLLDLLEVPFRDEAGAAGRPVDVVLATNMLSVGVNVRRLGLMAVCGQPKTTAEYIQATSRVGRAHPGLVLTVYNWARPRDLSHFERFGHYHATFYTHVEALSVTPFASRALDRGLFGVLVALLRLGDLELNGNESAELLPDHLANEREVIDYLAARAHVVTHRTQVRDDVRDRLTTLLDVWRGLADPPPGLPRLAYKPKGERRGLLVKPADEPWGERTCPQSLREVEPPVALVLVRAAPAQRTAAPEDAP